MHRNFTPTMHLPFTDRVNRVPAPPVTVMKANDSPSDLVINSIMNYSRALSVRKTKVTGPIHFILN